MRSQRGSAVVQYLMFIALVTAVSVPILVNNFGEPLIRTFKNERSKFVAIIGQTPKGRRKPPVPAEWFSKSPVPQIESDEISGGVPLSDGKPIESGEVPSGSPIQTGQVGGGSGLNGSEGGAGGGNNNGGGFPGSGGGPNRYAGAGTAGGGNSSGGEDFFSSPQGTSGKKGPGSVSEEDEGGGRLGRSRGGESDSGAPVRGDEAVGERKRNQEEKSKNEGDGTRISEGKSRSVIEAEQELNERTKGKKFDWWLIVKLLILLFIVALVFLMVIGNSRK